MHRRHRSIATRGDATCRSDSSQLGRRARPAARGRAAGATRPRYRHGETAAPRPASGTPRTFPPAPAGRAPGSRTRSASSWPDRVGPPRRGPGRSPPQPDGYEPVAHVAGSRPAPDPLAPDELRRDIDPAGVAAELHDHRPGVATIVAPLDPAGDASAGLEVGLIECDRNRGHPAPVRFRGTSARTSGTSVTRDTRPQCYGATRWAPPHPRPSAAAVQASSWTNLPTAS